MRNFVIVLIVFGVVILCKSIVNMFFNIEPYGQSVKEMALPFAAFKGAIGKQGVYYEEKDEAFFNDLVRNVFLEHRNYVAETGTPFQLSDYEAKNILANTTKTFLHKLNSAMEERKELGTFTFLKGDIETAIKHDDNARIVSYISVIRPGKMYGVLFKIVSTVSINNLQVISIDQVEIIGYVSEDKILSYEGYTFSNVPFKYVWKNDKLKVTKEKDVQENILDSYYENLQNERNITQV